MAMQINSETYKKIILQYENEVTINPTCSHFGLCGGCQWQNIPYDLQVHRKKKALSQLLGRDISVLPSPIEYSYRTKMDFVTAFGHTGLRPRGRHDEVIDVDYCHLITPRANELRNRTKLLCGQIEIPDYNYLRKEGFMRYFVIRQTGTGELMLVLVSKSPGPGQAELVNILAEKIMSENHPDSIWWVIQDRIADLSYGVPRQFWGNEHIIEKLGSLQYLVGPNTFFQSNIHVADFCFNEIRDRIKGKNILDLYCGTGVITLFVHDKSESILGVETDQENIDLADKNAERNSIGNARFACSDVRQFLIHNSEHFDTVILDPPRSGAGRKVIHRIVNNSPERIIYMSCSPDSLINDISFLDGYSLEWIQGFDMFPQTAHVELIAVFDKI